MRRIALAGSLFLLVILPVASGDYVKNWEFEIPNGYFIYKCSADIRYLPYEYEVSIPLSSFRLKNLTLSNETIMNRLDVESLTINMENISGKNIIVDDGIIHPKISANFKNLLYIEKKNEKIEYPSITKNYVIWEENLKTCILNFSSGKKYISEDYMMCPSGDEIDDKLYITWIDMDNNFSVYVGIFDGIELRDVVEIGKSSDFWGMWARRTFTLAHDDEVVVVWSRYTFSGWITEYVVLNKNMRIVERGNIGNGEAVGLVWDNSCSIYKIHNGTLYKSNLNENYVILDDDVIFASASSSNTSVAWISGDNKILKALVDREEIVIGSTNSSACYILSTDTTEIILLSEGDVYIRNNMKFIKCKRFSYWKEGFSKDNLFICVEMSDIFIYEFRATFEKGILEKVIPTRYNIKSVICNVSGNCSFEYYTDESTILFSACLTAHQWFKEARIYIFYYTPHGSGESFIHFSEDFEYIKDIKIEFECNIPEGCHFESLLSDNKILIEMYSSGSKSITLTSVKLKILSVNKSVVNFDIFSDDILDISTNGFVELTPYLQGYDSNKLIISTYSNISNYNITFNLSLKRHVYLKKEINKVDIREDSTKKINLSHYFGGDDIVRYEFISEYINYSIDGDILILSPEANWYGTTYGIIRAYDCSNYSIEMKFHVKVINVEDLHVIEIMGPDKIETGKLYKWRVNAYDPDNDFIEITLIECPEGMILRENTIYWTPTTTGKFKFVISSISKGHRVLEEYEVLVISAHTKNDDKSLDGGNPYNYNISINLVVLISLFVVLFMLFTSALAFGRKRYRESSKKGRCCACLSFFKNGEEVVDCKRCKKSYHKKCFSEVGKCAVCSSTAFHERRF